MERLENVTIVQYYSEISLVRVIVNGESDVNAKATNYNVFKSVSFVLLYEGNLGYNNKHIRGNAI